MTINDSLFSSEKHDWETPDEFFLGLNKRFSFEIDLAASKQNAKLDKFYTKEDDALTKDWKLISFLNPPYGRSINKWVEKSFHESTKWGSTIVMLIPARTDTIYFHEYVMRAKAIYFVKGRLTFVGAPSAAPFPSMVVEFVGPETPGFYQVPELFSINRKGNVLYGY